MSVHPVLSSFFSVPARHRVGVVVGLLVANAAVGSYIAYQLITRL